MRSRASRLASAAARSSFLPVSATALAMRSITAACSATSTALLRASVPDSRSSVPMSVVARSASDRPRRVRSWRPAATSGAASGPLASTSAWISVDSGPTVRGPAVWLSGARRTSARATGTWAWESSSRPFSLAAAAGSTSHALLPTSATIAPLAASLNLPSLSENTDASFASQRALPLRSTHTLACA